MRRVYLCPVFPTEDLIDIATNPLPTLWKGLADDAETLYQLLKSRIEAAGRPVEEKPLPPGRQGVSRPDGSIVLTSNFDSRNRIMVPPHELAHQLEHFRLERARASRDQKELGAESATAIVCAILGIEHPTAEVRVRHLFHGFELYGLKQPGSLVTHHCGRCGARWPRVTYARLWRLEDILRRR